jgi:hypothetical protein
MRLPDHFVSALLAALLMSFIVYHVWSDWPSSTIQREKARSTRIGAVRAKIGEQREEAPLLARGFSAVQVEADAYTAGDGHEFLTLYLDQDFPYSISDDDLVLLRSSAESSESDIKTLSDHYKAGMNFFFLALAQTVRLAAGSPADTPASITHLWNRCLQEFQKSGDIAITMSRFVQQIILAADQDGNQSLDSKEIASIITSNVYGPPE